MYFPVLLWSLVIFASFWGYGEALHHVRLFTARALHPIAAKNDFAVHDFGKSIFLTEIDIEPKDVRRVMRICC
jgi:hypothetical protein